TNLARPVRSGRPLTPIVHARLRMLYPARRVPGRRRERLWRSCRPGEVGLGQTGLAVELDAEAADLRALRLGHGQVRPNRMEHAVETDGLTGLQAEGHDVLDLKVDRLADANGVLQTIVAYLDWHTLDTE